MPDLFQYTWIVWIVITVACVVMELITLHLLFLMVAAGSLIGGLGTRLLGADWWVQVLSAAVLSGLLVFLIRPLLWRVLVKGRDVHLTNVDALSGMGARATVAFVDGAGFAKLANGETWTARLDDAHESVTVPPGARLSVVAIDGATAVVAPAPHPITAPDSTKG
ncbi:NfeD family protein [uncultured Amnibacterium sp.]|uniref:NfeD family protein n=1 Tax=uncultured Amnibacterium sp. TaxID=1631851 RepID=UPI0035C9AB77